MRIDQTGNPVARRRGLVVKEVCHEVLVYDTESDRAHCLNEAAAQVWKLCDGRRDARAIAQAMQEEQNVTVDEKVVLFALTQLGRDGLLEQQLVTPNVFRGMSRRQMMRTLGIATAVALPLVTSIVAPTAIQAASCRPSGASCNGSGQCCSGLCSSGTCA